MFDYIIALFVLFVVLNVPVLPALRYFAAYLTASR